MAGIFKFHSKIKLHGYRRRKYLHIFYKGLQGLYAKKFGVYMNTILFQEIILKQFAFGLTQYIIVLLLRAVVLVLLPMSNFGKFSFWGEIENGMKRCEISF